MRIVINADDFGQDRDTVEATIACIEAGAVTGASLMVHMPASEAALAYARAHPKLGWGVHLTFVGRDEERPVLPPAQVPALCRPDGRLRDSRTMRLLGLLRRLPVDQLAAEMTAQLGLARDHGVSLSHVDSHEHTHKFGSFRTALSQVLPRFGIRRVRSVQDVYLHRPLLSPTVWLGAYWRRALRSQYVSTDQFYMPTSAGDLEWGAPLLRVATGPTLEVGVHPGTNEPFRAAERAAVLDFARLARAAGHALITWREVG